MYRELSITLGLAVGACGLGGVEMKTKRVTFHGVTYDFPRDHIDAAVIPPEGRLYVRLAPPDGNYHLVLDEWSDRPSYQGPDVPRISRLNDVRFQKFEITHTPSGPVVCTDRQPHFNCGVQIEDGPVKWSALFDKKFLKHASNIREDATATIRRYRTHDR